MMNLEIFYKSNQDGNTLLNLIKENCEQVNSEETTIENIPFYHITIKNDGAKFTRVINSPQSQMNCIDRETMIKILSWNNIACKRNSRVLISRYYEILVFDISIISIKQKIPNRSTKAVSYIKQKACEKAAELSKKAVYHLGLDYAMVKIALTANKQYIVLNVDPSPSVRSIDLRKLMVKIVNSQNEDEVVHGRDVKLGADPEFMLSRKHRMIPASIYFPHHGKVGCDNIRTRDRQQHPIGELRPAPSISPLKLTENLNSALHTAVNMAPSRHLRWIAGSRPFKGYPIGGHIHFSNIKLNFAVLRALDNFLAIPVLMLENSNTAALRRKKYGALADFRVKKYGGFEYRTLSSWLVSLEITRAVLCLAKIIATQYLELNQNYLNTLQAQQAFYKGDKEYFKAKFVDLWSAICQTDLYNQYTDELQVIQDMINSGESWNEKDDFRKAWSLHKRSKKKLKINYDKPKSRKRKNHDSDARPNNNTVAARQRHRRNSVSSRRSHHARENSLGARSSIYRRSTATTISNATANQHFEPPKVPYRMAFTSHLR
jgi:hypothetical protein